MNTEQETVIASKKTFGLNMEIVIALLVSLVAVAAIVVSRKFPGTGLSTDIGSGRFPLIYACALIILSVILIIQNLRKNENTQIQAADHKDPDAELPSYRRAFIGVVATGIYLGMMQYLGYAIATCLYLTFLMGLLGMRHKVWNPILAIAISASIYYLFSAALNVPLPIGILFE